MTDEHKQLILKHNSLVRIVAGQMYKALGHQMEYDDILQCAYLGLIDAIDKFKPDKDIPFEVYAPHRIRGYILDETRRLDLVSKHMRAKIKANLHEDIEFCQYKDCYVAVPCRVRVDKLDLEQAVNKLSSLERKLIYYHYSKGLSLGEIALKLGEDYQKIVKIHKMSIEKLRLLLPQT